MNIQLYYLKRNFDVQKAERYFKERKISFQLVDLAKHALGVRELALFKAQLGLKTLVDEDCIQWKESTARFLSGEAQLLEALAQNPKLLRLPIVRNGRQVTSGFQPDAWATWN